MTRSGDKTRPAGSGGAGQPRYALPSDLAGSLRRLDDGELDRLLRAAAEEARRRGRPGDGDPSSPRRSASGKAPGRVPPEENKGRKPQPRISPGQERLIRAAFEAGVNPGTLARQFRVSRAQVERIVGGSKRSKR